MFEGSKYYGKIKIKQNRTWSWGNRLQFKRDLSKPQSRRWYLNKNFRRS